MHKTLSKIHEGIQSVLYQHMHAYIPVKEPFVHVIWQQLLIFLLLHSFVPVLPFLEVYVPVFQILLPVSVEKSNTIYIPNLKISLVNSYTSINYTPDTDQLIYYINSVWHYIIQF